MKEKKSLVYSLNVFWRSVSW